MIVIDTNVVSELMRPTPEPAVMMWFSEQDAAQLYLTAISEAELCAGAAILPAGRRRERLPAEEAAHLVAASTDDDGHLVLIMDASVWAARVRYMARELGAERIRIKVMPCGNAID